MGNREFATHECTREVQPHELLEFLGTYLLNALRRRMPTGVIYQAIDLAKPVDGLFEQSLHVLFDTDVARNKQHLDPDCPQLFFYFVSRLLIASRNHDPRAMPTEDSCTAQTNTLSAAGNDGNAIGQF